MDVSCSSLCSSSLRLVAKGCPDFTSLFFLYTCILWIYRNLLVSFSPYVSFLAKLLLSFFNYKFNELQVRCLSLMVVVVIRLHAVDVALYHFQSNFFT